METENKSQLKQKEMITLVRSYCLTDTETIL